VSDDKLHWEVLYRDNIDKGRGLWRNAEVLRSRVPGGWFVTIRSIGKDDDSYSIAFYPDPSHVWDGCSLPTPQPESTLPKSQTTPTASPQGEDDPDWMKLRDDEI
jgi:hypothetical protein